MEDNINNKKYIIHFKNDKNLLNLSEYNKFSYSILNPKSYSSSKLTTENLQNIECNNYGIELVKNSTGFSPFISITEMTSYIEQDEDFTIYFRLKPESGGLNNLTIDLYNTLYPGTEENTSLKYFKFGIYSGKLTFISNSETSLKFEYDLSFYIDNKQYHIALSRMNNVIRAYIDGVKLYDSYDNGENSIYYGKPIFFTENKITDLYIGCNRSSEKVYLDDIVICKGYAFFRYTDFKVPIDFLSPKCLTRKVEYSDVIKTLSKRFIENNMCNNFNASRFLNITNKFLFKINRNVVTEDSTFRFNTKRNIIAKDFNLFIRTNRIIISENFNTLIKTKRNVINKNFKLFIKTNRIIVTKDFSLFINTNRKILFLCKSYNSTLLNYITNKIIINNIEREVFSRNILKFNTSRTVLNYRINLHAFIFNPLYTRKGV